MVLASCRDYRRTQLILAFDMVYPFSWALMYTFVNVVPAPEDNGSARDWAWRVFFGCLAVTMFGFSARTLLRSFQDSQIPLVYQGMLEWLAVSLIFCLVQWIANGVLGYWGAFWVTLAIRFFLVIMTALFMLDVRRLAIDAAVQSLQPGMQHQLSGSGSRLNTSFKCKVM